MKENQNLEDPEPEDLEGDYIYLRWITNWRTGKRIYPKGKAFRISRNNLRK
mgnify:CR=1 FL=1|jgi:hypothetical protein